MTQAIRNKQGQVLGYFVSEAEFMKMQYALAKTEFPAPSSQSFDPAEVAKAMTTKEAIAKLEQLARAAHGGA